VTIDSTLADVALPPPVVLTAYYVASEALANVTKHAHATLARVQLSTDGGELLLRIDDDGVRGADRVGTGLSGLSDRIHALDGRLRVHSPDGAGTIVDTRLSIRARCDGPRTERPQSL
jgi:signal transduction histidine kinase